MTESQNRDLEELVLFHAVILSLCVTLGKTIHFLGSCLSYLQIWDNGTFLIFFRGSVEALFTDIWKAL